MAGPEEQLEALLALLHAAAMDHKDFKVSAVGSVAFHSLAFTQVPNLFCPLLLFLFRPSIELRFFFF